MATGSLLVKAVMIYLGINLMLYAGGVRVGQLTSGENIFSGLVTTSNDTAPITDSNVQYGVGIIGNQSNLPNVNQQTGGISGALSFIDVVRSVANVINFLIVMVGGIFIVFLTFPAPVQLFLGVPLAITFILGLIYFARSGQ